MYEVFVNESPLILTNERPENTNGNLFSLDGDSIMEAIHLLSKKKLKKAYLYHPDGNKILKLFMHKIPVIVAGGGFVVNEKGKVLFIKRNGKWDLPKGKVDKGETIESAAIREVEEETGVTGLKIERFLRTTYHVFKRNGEYWLKQTHWFLMSTDYTGKLVAEKAEGIEKVKWKGPIKTQKAIKNSYKNIEILFKEVAT
ncbi:NUDIX hydrolase [Flagellimonas aequoris]|uniref:NUDIX domain-containing protein n=1 Tax=Flagellimonas aequoris TaxID=2306997 RepID=A0A418N2G0_9FLAO|nr:NUDIX domain-containing protein [Allomuricauda aequoris]RIV67503.1 NUDIX domain-containing protein [Allomuricauda aequoris]TXJ99327.1 NUDIX domain-containing protein [Allomuricauda aequoris]